MAVFAIAAIAYNIEFLSQIHRLLRRDRREEALVRARHKSALQPEAGVATAAAADCCRCIADVL
jgi:hypothetical protein